MTILPLISPNGSNFIKDFPAQHAVNMGLIDAYANSCLTSQPLKTYTPLLTASITNPTLGTGAIMRGVYYEIFNQIYLWGEFRFGTSGSSSGVGTWGISLPFSANPSIATAGPSGQFQIIGAGTLWVQAVSANIQPINVHLRDSNNLQFTVKMNSGAGFRDLTSSTPVTWAAQDGLTWFAHYQRV
jgi:hypothetical protein